MKLLQIIPHFLTNLKQWWLRDYVAPTEHEEVMEHATSEGELSSRYLFMVGISCAIAMLGLLLSSPAVVIGAMLVSPLMGPIMSLGFSLCTLNMSQMRRALLGIITGFLMAVAISWLIVTLSPITDATPEIMGRTQPNLFDLLVALFSGLAGGYAVIKRKGEGIVGVAIATALMPPLAVVGYGLAMGNSDIYGGAFMLFMTNLLAISLSVSVLAKWYGFGVRHKKRGHTFWQAVLVLGTFIALSFPLGVALKNIAYQTYVTQTAKQTITTAMGEDSRISLFNISFPASTEAPLLIDSVVLTSNFNKQAQRKILEKLETTLETKIRLKLDQVVVAKEAIQNPVKTVADNTLTAPSSGTVSGGTRSMASDDMVTALKQAAFFPTRFIEVDKARQQATLHPDHIKGMNLDLLQQFEQSLEEKFPSWKIQVVAPMQALPTIAFETGQNIPTPAGETALQNIQWALKNWGISNVDVIGFASTVGEFDRFDNRTLAYQRAHHITQKLAETGISATTKREYHYATQRRQERDYGTNSFHKVEIRLAQPINTAN